MKKYPVVGDLPNGTMHIVSNPAKSKHPQSTDCRSFYALPSVFIRSTNAAMSPATKTVVYSNGAREDLAANERVRIQYLQGVEASELEDYESAAADAGWDTTFGELVSEHLPTSKARQREWVLVRNDNDGGWTVVDAVATRQANA